MDNDVTLHTFELAPMLQYNFSEEDGHFFIKAGPSIDVQLFGKEKFNKSGGGSVNRNMKFSFGDYGRFGANLLLQAGYETAGGFVIFAHYTHGIGSIVNTDNGPPHCSPGCRDFHWKVFWKKIKGNYIPTRYWLLM
ncbi:MAG: PorT family protein [Bacteroidetes bacterium]|nr:PorT family protein [Bacteroidota bacterium]